MKEKQEMERIEDKVRKLSGPLNKIMDSLDPTIRPAKRLSYSWNDDFDDDFGKWADDTPPPWEGEDRVV